MNTEILMQYVSYLLMAIGVAAFIVSAITQVIKELPYLKNVQTNVVALVASLILCPVIMMVTCRCFGVIITWYHVFASFIAAFIVYLVSTGGWEKVTEMWKRTKYRNNSEGE